MPEQVEREVVYVERYQLEQNMMKQRGRWEFDSHNGTSLVQENMSKGEKTHEKQKRSYYERMKRNLWDIILKFMKQNCYIEQKRCIFIRKTVAIHKCYPAIGTITRELGLSRQTVECRIQDLILAGFLIKEQRFRENGGKRSLLYTIFD